MVTRFGAFHPHPWNVCVLRQRGPRGDIVLECVPPPCLPSQKQSRHLACTRKSSPSILCFCATTVCKPRELNVPGSCCSDASRKHQENVDGFKSRVSSQMSLRFYLSWNGKPVTATHWINDLEHTWTFDLSKTFDLVPIISGASMRYLRRAELLYIGMEKVWHLQHQISRCCADIFTVSAREVCMGEPLCFSWRLVEAGGLSKDAMKPSCRTMQTARVVTLRKLKQKSIVSTSAKETPQATPTLLTFLPRLTGFCLKLE